MTLPGMYGDLAPWFHLLTAPEEYADDAAFVLDALRQHVDGPLETLLELGSGGGNTASHLKRDLRLTLTDLSPQMLELSQTINPECEHVAGDMRTLRLERTFDAVLVHDAICYMTTEADLRAAMTTAFDHLRPGGAAVFDARPHPRDLHARAPTTAGTTVPGSRTAARTVRCATSSGPPTRILTTRRTRSTTRCSCVARMARSRFVGTSTSRGCSRRQTWLDLLGAVGFEAHAVVDPERRTVFIGRRPARAG